MRRPETKWLAWTVMGGLLATACGGVQQGNWQMARGDHAAAEKTFTAILADRPDDVAARRRLGLVYFNTGRYELAAAQFKEARTASVPDAQLLYGLSLVGAGRTAEGCQEMEAFSHPTLYRITQEIRAEVGRGCGQADPSVLRARLRRAWDEGVRQEEIDRRGEDGGGGAAPNAQSTLL